MKAQLIRSIWVGSFLLGVLQWSACDDDTAKAVCGNGAVEAGEACDGTDLAQETCASRGFEKGDLACSEDCVFDESGCSKAVCGNGQLEEGEECEEGDFSETCRDFGFEMGTLACDAECLFDLSLCVIPITCGDGNAMGWEDCENGELGGETCEALGFAGGSLLCDDSCQFDTLSCIEEETCGNGILDPKERCDGTVPAGLTCESIGYPQGGTLGCASDCTLDVSGCDPACAGSQIGDPCTPGTTVCCAEDNRPVGCVELSTWGYYCWPTCEAPLDCGLNDYCVDTQGDANGACMGTPGCMMAYSPCLGVGGEQGNCVKLGLAMDAQSNCTLVGMRRQGQSCDPTITGGQMDYHLNDMCYQGWCIPSAEDPLTGTCRNYCDWRNIFSGLRPDTCPDHYNCLSQLDIYLNPSSYENGYTINDFGYCYPMFDGVDAVTTAGLLACDLLSNDQTRSGLPCPVGTACLPYLKGSLQGVCSPVSTTPKSLGEACDPNAEVSECAADAACVMSDPFHETDLTEPVTACRRKCDAEVLEDNALCADLEGGPFVCLTRSRFYSYSHQLPTTFGPETAPSRQGFCVPPQ
ncbi:hypothetical protein KKF84_19810 [Myxococcota bacterium]|nr:hypothetical protein [Myxococcota bacterium]